MKGTQNTSQQSTNTSFDNDFASRFSDVSVDDRLPIWAEALVFLRVTNHSGTVGTSTAFKHTSSYESDESGSESESDRPPENIDVIRSVFPDKSLSDGLLRDIYLNSMPHINATNAESKYMFRVREKYASTSNSSSFDTTAGGVVSSRGADELN